jgi:lysyl-tRNA synthetase class 1
MNLEIAKMTDTRNFKSQINLETSPHWADHAAKRVVAFWGPRKPDQNQDNNHYTVASGITPSGTVHIGNFREVITVDLVARALRGLGHQVRFIYSWDDFDTFRKVPKNLPNQEMLTEQLRRPISRVPDPRGVAKSYSGYGIMAFEKELAQVGVQPEYIYQHERYSSGAYAEQIKFALENKDKITAILNEYRSEPLPPSWLPTAIYCEKCDRDTMEYERYPGGWDYAYKCATCGHEAVTDIRKTRNLKLNWRTDWPMRWAYEKVDFEPGGKDHSSEGGSYDTGKRIVKAVWDREPPVYQQYDFVMIKGGTGKMSSSSGELFTVAQALEVYPPQILRWIFAGHRPNHDFSLAFDADVIKTYDEFDRAEAVALDPAQAATDKKWPMTRRVYELSAVDGEVPARAPYRAPFRELCNRLQIFDGDATRTMERYYRDFIRDEADKSAFLDRAQRASNWLRTYAPEEFRYSLTAGRRNPADFTAEQRAAMTALVSLVNEVDLETVDPKDLNQLIYDKVIHASGCDPKEAFKGIYQKFIGRDQGPRLPGFLKELGRDRVNELLGAWK